MIRKPSRIKPSDITPESVYFNRRKFVKAAIASGTLMATGSACSRKIATAEMADVDSDVIMTPDLADVVTSQYSTTADPNSWQDITTYNNFYEFGLGKDDPHKNVGSFNPDPWTVEISGEADVVGKFAYEDFVKPHTLEERIYRLRCVEAWSMVVPWVGISLGDILKRFKPTSKARFVEFKTLYDPKQMPGQRRSVLDWPYVEGLTIEEAMNPLTILAVGLYGKELPKQNGAPLRLVVPWKYGFKSIKSIVSIRFTEKRPRNTWYVSAPREYGFYANVNPEVDHPRWSQARERPIGNGLFSKKIPTQMFNGYGEEVASLYTGLDLKKNF
ncbi:MAG: protein-methionine-sulfoxide reductase catalytic subunit MsrP [Gammaproteobacteria bacterium]